MACDECGAVLDGGVEACNALSFDMMARSLDARRLVVRRTLVDAYALQHPRTQCERPEDVARHLLRLCCAIEYDGSLDIYSGIKIWLKHAYDLPELRPPDMRGSMTILDAAAADGLEIYIVVVRKWSVCVWDAWHLHHEIVRSWVKEIRDSR